MILPEDIEVRVDRAMRWVLSSRTKSMPRRFASDAHCTAEKKGRDLGAAGERSGRSIPR